VRNNVRVPGLAAWDEVARALTGDAPSSAAADDSLFDAVLGARDDSALTTGDAEQAPPEDDDPVESKASQRLVELQISRPLFGTLRVPLRRTRMTLGSAPGCDGKVPEVAPQWLLVELDDARATITVLKTGERHQLALNQSAVIDGGRVVLSPIPFRDLPMSAKIRAATIGDAFIRGEAVRDPAKVVAMAAIKSPGVTDTEAAAYARNQALDVSVIGEIAKRGEWTKKYAVKVSLCRNPKAPIATVNRFLPFLRQKDLVSLSKSKGISSAVVAQARKLVSQRGGKP
jgi:hypothetical protein